jgi:5'-nucleotidase / UDP-sugar diphosphatase
MIESIRKSEPATLLLDCGALFDDKKDTAEFQLQAMALMGYDALNLGSPEFTFGKGFLEQTRSKISFPYISSNLLSGGSRIPWTREYLIKEVGGVKVAILGVLDPDGLARLPDREQVKGLEVIPPEAALKRLLPEVRGKVDLVILLSQFDVENTLALVRAVNGIDVAISSASDGVFFPPATDKETAVLLQTGSQGKTLGFLKITLDEKRALRVSEKKYVSLDNSVPGNREIETLVATVKKAQETEQEKLRRERQENIRKEQAETLKLSPQEFMERYRKEQTGEGGAR